MEVQEKGMRMQLKVMKTDGGVEEYFHTKVIGTVGNALSTSGQTDVFVAEQLAEAVTYFLYQKRNSRTAVSSEIYSVIKAVLTATGYHQAAVALSEYHCRRKIKRSRIEVLSADIRELADAERLGSAGELTLRSRWDKSEIVTDLVTKHGVSRQTARVIASMVEEKILNMQIMAVPTSLIKQIVLNDAAAMLRAGRQLQSV